MRSWQTISISRKSVRVYLVMSITAKLKNESNVSFTSYLLRKILQFLLSYLLYYRYIVIRTNPLGTDSRINIILFGYICWMISCSTVLWQPFGQLLFEKFVQISYVSIDLWIFLKCTNHMLNLWILWQHYKSLLLTR